LHLKTIITNRGTAIGRKPNTDVLRPLSSEYPDDETIDGLLIIRPEGSLYFINLQDVADQMKILITQYHPQVIVLDMSRIPNIEYSALQRLVESEQVIAGNGTTLWLAGLNPDVLEVVRRSGLAERLGRERMLFNTRIAIERYKALHS
jgi:MFS superfamily sulfate permease-like transporter